MAGLTRLGAAETIHDDIADDIAEDQPTSHGGR
jgi:hypothetical protein